MTSLSLTTSSLSSGTSSSSTSSEETVVTTIFESEMSGHKFSFKISSSYKPNMFTQEDMCPIGYHTFTDFAQDYFQRDIICRTAYYFVALIEDQSKSCALYDLESLKSFFSFKEWSEAAFTNPKSRSLCDRIRIFGIDKLGGVSPFATCVSMASFQNLSQVSLLKRLYYKDWQQVQHPPSLYLKFLIDLSDEEALSWLDLVFKDKELGWSFDWNSIDAFLTRGEFARTVMLIETLDKRYGDHPRVQDYLAECFNRGNYWNHSHFLRLKNLDRAAEHYEKAINAYTNKSFARSSYQSLGMIYKDLLRYEKAIECCKAALRIRPDDYTLYCLLGEIFLADGRHIDALEALQKSLSLDPEDQQARIFLAETYKLLGDFAEAKKHLGLILEYTGINIYKRRAFGNLAEIARIVTDFDGAKVYLQQADKELPEYLKDHDSDKLFIEEQKKQLEIAEKISCDD